MDSALESPVRAPYFRLFSVPTFVSLSIPAQAASASRQILLCTVGFEPFTLLLPDTEFGTEFHMRDFDADGDLDIFSYANSEVRASGITIYENRAGNFFDGNSLRITDGSFNSFMFGDIDVDEAADEGALM